MKNVKRNHHDSGNFENAAIGRKDQNLTSKSWFHFSIEPSVFPDEFSKIDAQREFSPNTAHKVSTKFNIDVI